MRSILARLFVGGAAALLAQAAQAGGRVEIENPVFPADSNATTNAWFPLPPGIRFTYFAETEDE